MTTQDEERQIDLEEDLRRVRQGVAVAVDKEVFVWLFILFVILLTVLFVNT